MDNIEKVVLELAEEMDAQGTAVKNVLTADLIEFAKALLARLSEDAEPIGWIDIDGCWISAEDIVGEPLKRWTPLFLHPPLTQQEQPRSVPEWQPIETAPKDNKRPLLLARFNDDGTLQSFDYDGSWEKDRESWEIPQAYWYWASACGNVEEPSHWMYQPDNFAMIAAAPKDVLRSVPEWQLIESAPKNGTEILFSDKHGQRGICWWGKKAEGEGWLSDSCNDFGGFEYPANWMSLPDAPQEPEWGSREYVSELLKEELK